MIVMLGIILLSLLIKLIGPAIFGLWDDLNPVNDSCNEYCSGNVYYHSDNNKMVIWFNDVAHWYTNFQIPYMIFKLCCTPQAKLI